MILRVMGLNPAGGMPFILLLYIFCLLSMLSINSSVPLGGESLLITRKQLIFSLIWTPSCVIWCKIDSISTERAIKCSYFIAFEREMFLKLS